VPLTLRRAALVTSGFLITGLLWYATARIRVPTGFAARYFTASDQSSRPLMTAIDDRIASAVVHHDWPLADQPFTARWDAFLVLNRSGAYRFAVLSGDDARLYLDEKLAVDNGGPHRLRQVTTEVRLDRGVHTVRVEERHDAGPVSMEVLWANGQAVPLVPLAGLNVSPTQPSKSDRRRLAVLSASRAILPALLIVEWLAILLAFVVIPATRWFIARHAPDGLPTECKALLIGAAGLYLAGSTWGLPGPGWAGDEMRMQDLADFAGHHFAQGWWNFYPPMHFYLLTIVTLPFLAWERLDPIAYSGSFAPFAAVALIRASSIGMAVGTVLATYLSAAYFYRVRPALVAACLVALTMPMLYYAKVANVDVPYVFWFSVSLVCLARIASGAAMVDYIIFAVAATLAVCTKDQAIGLFALPVLAIVGAEYAATGGVKKVAVAAVAALVTFVLVQNIAFNSQGFLEHVRFVTLKSAYNPFEPTPAGEWRLWQMTWMLIRLSFGWPAFLLCLGGLVLAVTRPEAARPRFWWLLLPAASYYFTFLVEVRALYDRFLLPMFIPLAFAGGFLVQYLDRLSGRPRRWMHVAVAGVLAYTLVYAAAVNAAMLQASRYAVEQWIRDHIEPGATVGRVGPIQQMPRINDHLVQLLSPTRETIQSTDYEYVIVNSQWAERFSGNQAEFVGLRDLEAGRLGYRPVYESTRAISFAGIPFTSRFAFEGSTGYSTLTKINPGVTVYKRVNPETPAPIARTP